MSAMVPDAHHALSPAETLTIESALDEARGFWRSSR